MNDVGDLVLSDEQTIDALADPVRFRLFSHVQRTGRVHEEALAVALGVTADAVRTSLRLLASVGALAPQAERAVRRLNEVMMLDTSELPARGRGIGRDGWMTSGSGLRGCARPGSR